MSKYDILQLNDMLVPELKELAERLQLKAYKRLNKQELIYKILDHQAIADSGSSSESTASNKRTNAPRTQQRKAPPRKPRTPQPATKKEIKETPLKKTEEAKTETPQEKQRTQLQRKQNAPMQNKQPERTSRPPVQQREKVVTPREDEQKKSSSAEIPFRSKQYEPFRFGEFVRQSLTRFINYESQTPIKQKSY